MRSVTVFTDPPVPFFCSPVFSVAPLSASAADTCIPAAGSVTVKARDTRTDSPAAIILFLDFMFPFPAAKRPHMPDFRSGGNQAAFLAFCISSVPAAWWFITATAAMTTRKITVDKAQRAVLIVVCDPLVALTT